MRNLPAAALFAALAVALPVNAQWPDCNLNFRNDWEDIQFGQSQDCNHNGVPDSCDLRPLRGFEKADLFSAGGALAAADLDADGRADLVTQSMTAAGTVTVAVLWGPGNGAFLPPEPLSQEGFPVAALAVADLDGNGSLDVAWGTQGTCCQHADGRVGLLLNRGGRRFESGQTAFQGRAVDVLVPGDLNGDGAVDLVALTHVMRSTISLLFNRGDGTFLPPRDMELAGLARSLVVVDLDQKNGPDLVVTDSGLSIFLNLGDGTFARAQDPERAPGEWVAAGDLNGDSLPDIILTSAGNPHAVGAVSLYLNLGGGALAPPRPIHGPRFQEFPSATILVDLNGDHRLDVAAVDSPGILLFFNEGEASFTDPVLLDARLPLYGGGPAHVVALDADSDGDEDLAMAGVRILRNRGNGTFSVPTLVGVEDIGTSMEVELEDLNGDGQRDLALVASNSRVSVYWNRGNRRFDRPVFLAVSEPPVYKSMETLAVGDLDGDRRLDLAAGNYAGDISVLWNEGEERFTLGEGALLAPYITYLAVGDLDGNGKPDLAASHYRAGSVSVLFNRGGRSFSEAQVFPVAPGLRGLACADLDGDGALDLSVASETGSVWVLWNEGQGTLAEPRPFLAGKLPYTLTPAHLDRDGKLDLAVALWDGGAVAVLRNLGDRRFASPHTVVVEDAPQEILAADLDADGDQDLAVSKYRHGAVVLWNEGDGVRFVQQVLNRDLTRGGGAAGDVDGDGNPEVAFTTYQGVLIFWNGQGPPRSADCDADGVPDECQPGRCSPQRFVRGDSNASGAVDLSDAVFTLAHLFQGGSEPSCRVASDANDDGRVDIADATYTLSFLFLGGPRISAPYPACGPARDAGDLTCQGFPPCEQGA